MNPASEAAADGGLQAMRAWFELQALTLQRLHPSWLPLFDAELLAEAGRRQGGRRWLARQLADHSLLFGAIGELPSGPYGWLEPLLRDSAELLADLGARALAPALRTVVAREELLELRAALGPARYEAALRSAPAALPPQMIEDLKASPGAAVTALAQRYGARELAACAALRHPAWGESVRLSFERGWCEPAEPLLPADTVEAVLLERSSD